MSFLFFFLIGLPKMNDACHTLLQLKREKTRKETIRERAKVKKTIPISKENNNGKRYKYVFSSYFLDKPYPVDVIRYQDERDNYIVHFKMLIAHANLRQGNISRLLKDYDSPIEKVLYENTLWLTRAGCERFLKDYCDKIDKTKRYVLFGPHSMDFITFLTNLTA